MKIDRFDFWLLFSAVLLFFVLVNFIIKFFYWLKFRQDLSYIKQKKVKNIIDYNSPVEKGIDLVGSDFSQFKKEMDELKRSIFLDTYDKGFQNKESIDFVFNFEEALEKLLDGKILDLIKDKDDLLKQKDILIGSLEEKNRKIIVNVLGKMFFLLEEKDRVLKEKDGLISILKTKIEEEFVCSIGGETECVKESLCTKQIPSDQKRPIYYYHTDFINVNLVGGK